MNTQLRTFFILLAAGSLAACGGGGTGGGAGNTNNNGGDGPSLEKSIDADGDGFVRLTECRSGIAALGMTDDQISKAFFERQGFMPRSVN